VSKLGCKQSIDDTIKYRIQKLTSKANDILLIADAPQLGAEKTSTAAIKLFEAQIISELLFNCESWRGITEAEIDELQSFQDNFLKKLLHLPVSTPKAILHWDGGMEMMKWRIAKRMFMRKMMMANSENICKKAILNEIIIGTKGLASECKELGDELGIRDVRFCEVKGVKMNHKSSHRNDLSCSFCNGPMEESQEHLEEECTGCDFERRTLKMNTMRGRQTFWRRMKAKIEEKN
jgi:hypothetical protein